MLRYARIGKGIKQSCERPATIDVVLTLYQGKEFDGLGLGIGSGLGLGVGQNKAR